jgi:ketosteroid isomerase-like protein
VVEIMTDTDVATLVELNDAYIQSVQRGDVRRFEQLLADDFLCSPADGSLLDRQRFLERTAQPVTIRDLAAHDVVVRVMGDVAIIHARTTFTTLDGRAGTGRYTDIWARRGGRWLAVAAHVTRTVNS